jgi:hypothetical protein
MLTAAVEAQATQIALADAGVIAARRKRRTDTRGIANTVAAFQVKAADEALASVERMLAEQDIDAPAVGRLPARAFAGTASDGRGLVSLFDQATSAEALAQMVATQILDTGRSGAAASIAARPDGIGYIRVISAGACSRCAVLAGKFYRYNEGFPRHVNCACTHEPTTLSNMKTDDLRTNPDLYFRSLSPADQDRLFGQASAEAIRHGADMSQVVNAHRGMSTAQSGIKVTTAGTTRRGVFGRANPGKVRLMPETIIKLASTREEAQLLLRRYGYII